MYNNNNDYSRYNNICIYNNTARQYNLGRKKPEQLLSSSRGKHEKFYTLESRTIEKKTTVNRQTLLYIIDLVQATNVQKEKKIPSYAS